MRGNISLNDVLEVAKEFRTSLHATALRFNELRGASIFEAEDGKLRWGYGVVRSDFDIASDSSLARVVNSAALSDFGTEEVILTVRNRANRWTAEWKRIGDGHRTVFMLHPMAR